MNLEMLPLQPDDSAGFRDMVLAYWHELMPKAGVLKDAASREAYFRKEFGPDGTNKALFWAVQEGRRAGFVHFTLYEDEKRAYVEDFYVLPEVRRQGCGTAIVRWLLAYLDGHGIEQIDLNVRRDNPNALAFWQAQGFGIAGYRLRQYRDPGTGTAFKGALSSDF